jgi:hypothetical protein
MSVTAGTLYAIAIDVLLKIINNKHWGIKLWIKA